MIRCATKRGRFAHYTRGGGLTLCNFTAVPLGELGSRRHHRMVQAPICSRCNKAAGAEGVK